MKPVLACLLALSICLGAHAQTVFAPVGTHWNYTWNDHSGAYNGPRSLYYTGDTIIATVTYKKIAAAWSYSCLCPNPLIGSSYNEFVLERNDSVFQAFPWGPSFQLLYAFNQNAGDTISFTQSIPYQLVYDSMQIQFICNQNRRVLYYTKLENGCSDSVRIIEGIGPVNDYLFSQGIASCELGPGQYTFNCADIGSCVYPPGACASVPLSTGLFTPSATTITCFSGDMEVVLSFSEKLTGEIRLYDPLGKMVRSIRITDAVKAIIPRLDLAAGVYMVDICAEQVNVRKKIAVY